MDHIGEGIPGAMDSLGVEYKPIPTTYRGTRFRSRLEARWAVFLAHIGLDYDYEFEGFALRSGYYLPDFWLPKLETWLEIKPVQADPPSAMGHDFNERMLCRACRISWDKHRANPRVCRWKP